MGFLPLASTFEAKTPGCLVHKVKFEIGLFMVLI